VIDPLDEAPFHVWGDDGSALGGLTATSSPARIGRDVLATESVRFMGTRSARERTSPTTTKTATFLLELPLAVNAGQAARLRAHLEAARQRGSPLEAEPPLPTHPTAKGNSRAHTCSSPQERARATSPPDRGIGPHHHHRKYLLHRLAETLRQKRGSTAQNPPCLS